jgi:hypothetical protein
MNTEQAKEFNMNLSLTNEDVIDLLIALCDSIEREEERLHDDRFDSLRLLGQAAIKRMEDLKRRIREGSREF